MKSMIMRLGLIACSLFGVAGFVNAELTQEEKIQHRKQSVRDWQKVTRVMNQAGIPESDSAYKRVQAILKGSKTRLANLEAGGSAGVAKKAIATGTTAAAAGSLLERLGLYSTAKKGSEAPTTKPIEPKKTAPKIEKRKTVKKIPNKKAPNPKR